MSEESFDVSIVGAEPTAEQHAEKLAKSPPAKKPGRPRKESAAPKDPPEPKKPRAPKQPKDIEPIDEGEDPVVRVVEDGRDEFVMKAVSAGVGATLATTNKLSAIGKHVEAIHGHLEIALQLNALNTMLLTGVVVLLLLK